MTRLLELLLGLRRGFLARHGELSLRFNPRWPCPGYVSPTMWNLALAGVAIWLVVHVYRRESRSLASRTGLGIVRGLLLTLVIVMLNRPMLTRTQTRTDPSVVAVLVDDSVSMRVTDAGPAGAPPKSRLAAAVDLLDGGLLRELSAKQEVHLYRFDRTATPLMAEASQAGNALHAIQADGERTQLGTSIAAAMQDLQGRRLAGVIVLSDARSTPATPVADAIAAVTPFGVKVFGVPLGTDAPVKNVAIDSLAVQDTAFIGDLVNVKATVRGSGYPPGTMVHLSLINQKTGEPLVDATGHPAAAEVSVGGNDGSAPIDAELACKAAVIGTLDIAVRADPLPGEIDAQDNERVAEVDVVDSKIAVLYVEGYPRWEYRYLKNEMIRDRTVDISCLLTSADPTFAQEGDRPIQRFPETMDELLSYDVVLIGDVDSRQFTDAQLQLISDFASKKGGGVGFIAGPRYTPAAFGGTPLEAVMPVDISGVAADDVVPSSPLTAGFRPAVTRAGDATGLFRFLPDREANDHYLCQDLPPLYWYCRGVMVKPGVGETQAEHPTESGPDGRKAPLLVLGRYGAGRTLFSAIDDSWRWRFYTGESTFDTYWIEQLRYLARGRRLGQRRMAFAVLRPTYELGEQVQLQLRVLDGALNQQLPEAIRVQVFDPGGQPTRDVTLHRRAGAADEFAGSFPAEQTGKFSIRLGAMPGKDEPLQVPVEIVVPQLELADPRVDKPALARLAAETFGAVVEPAEAVARLPGLIPNATRIIPLVTQSPVWDAPAVMGAIIGLLVLEWVMRKLNGMV